MLRFNPLSITVGQLLDWKSRQEERVVKEQKCSQFNGQSRKLSLEYKECQNIAELHHVGLDKGYYMDFCAMHNHMLKTGIPLKCWRCGDKYA